MSDKYRKTATGRHFSDPKLQNIPIRTDLGFQIRRAFASKENLFLIDYAQIEMRILDRLSRDGGGTAG